MVKGKKQSKQKTQLPIISLILAGKESSFILDMHKSIFHCPPAYLDYWMLHFRGALDKVDFGPRSEEIKNAMLTWSAGFGKAMINAKDGELPTKSFGMHPKKM